MTLDMVDSLSESAGQGANSASPSLRPAEGEGKGSRGGGRDRLAVHQTHPELHPEHTSGLRFPASLAVRCGHMMRYQSVACEWSDGCHLQAWA